MVQRFVSSLKGVSTPAGWIIECVEECSAAQIFSDIRTLPAPQTDAAGEAQFHIAVVAIVVDSYFGECMASVAKYPR